MDRYFFTKEDFEALCRRIAEVEQKVREHTFAVGQVVDSSGDAWHDNQLYYEQRMSESWSSNLRKLIEIKRQAEIIDKPPPDDGTIRFGSIVKCKDLETETVFVYRISSYMIDESQEQNEIKRISYVSPMGKLLIYAKIGDIVEGKIGGNKKRLEILEIK